VSLIATVPECVEPRRRSEAVLGHVAGTNSWHRQLVWFSAIGIVMTLAYLGLYQGLRAALGVQLANLAAWVLTSVVDTSANRRFTFAVHGRTGAARAQGEGMLVFAVGLVLTTAALAILDATVADPNVAAEASVQLVANGLAGLLRFLVLREWVFRPSGH